MSTRKFAAPSTLGLFLVTVSTYMVQVLAGGDIVERAIGLIPARVSNLSTLTAVGGGQLVPAWLTLITYLFPHRGVLSNLVDEPVSGGGGLGFDSVDELNSGNHIRQELAAV